MQSSIAETRVRVVAKALITHPRNPNAHGKLTLIRDLDCETILIVVNLISVPGTERFGGVQGTTNISRWNRVQHMHSRIDRLSAVVLSGCGDCAPNDVGVVAPPTDRASRQHIQGDVSYGIFPPVVPPFRSFGSCVCVCVDARTSTENHELNSITVAGRSSHSLAWCCAPHCTRCTSPDPCFISPSEAVFFRQSGSLYLRFQTFVS